MGKTVVKALYGYKGRGTVVNEKQLPHLVSIEEEATLHQALRKSFRQAELCLKLLLRRPTTRQLDLIKGFKPIKDRELRKALEQLAGMVVPIRQEGARIDAIRREIEGGRRHENGRTYGCFTRRSMGGYVYHTNQACLSNLLEVILRRHKVSVVRATLSIICTSPAKQSDGPANKAVPGNGAAELASVAT